MSDQKNVFETKIAPILQYVGFIGAVITSIAYIITVIILVIGFKVEELLTTTVFAFVNAAVGFLIMQFLKLQGQSFAENLLENKKLLTEYYNEKTKDKKLHTIRYYWVTSIIKDIFIKALTLAGTSIGIIYIVIKGSNDISMILLAVVNLFFFISFGLLSLNKAYQYYNNYHVPYIKEQLRTKKCSNSTENSSET